MIARALVLVVAAGCGPRATPPSPTLPPPAVVAPAPAPVVAPSPPAGPVDREPWRARPPRVPALGRFTPPTVQKLALKNGIPVLVVENHALPLVVVQLVVKGGAGADPPGKAGLAALTANLLDEGAGKRNAAQLAEAADALGSDLETGAEYDVAYARVDGLLEQLGPSLDLLADVVLRPRFAPAEVERVKSETRAELEALRQDGAAWSGVTARRVIFGEAHPYGRPVIGTGTSLAGLTAADVVALHREIWHPGHAAFVVVGDVVPAEVVKLLDARFGAWKAGPGARKPAAPPAPGVRGGRTVHLVDRPGAAQGDMTIAFVGPPRTTPDWPALVVLNNALGGMFSSRLNLNLREDKGWTYGAHSRFEGRRETGLFRASAGLVTDKAAPGVAESLKELEGLAARPPAGEELARAKDAETRGMAGLFAENEQIAQAVTMIFAYDLPLDYHTRFLDEVERLTAADVAAAVTRHVHAAGAAVIVVGDAARLEAELGKVTNAKVQRE